MKATVLRLGLAQTLSWASSYYLPALLAPHWARDFGLSLATVMGAFSGALLIAALVGPAVGRWVDQHGGRGLLLLTNAVFAAGLVTMALAHSTTVALLGTALLGLAMGAGLYDTAFASLVRWYGQDARRAITGITLIAGFASTVGWPLTAWMTEAWGWRNACWGWAALQLVLGLTLNAGLPRGTGRAQPETPSGNPVITPAEVPLGSAPNLVASGATPHTPAVTVGTTTGSTGAALSRTSPWRNLLLLALAFAALRFASTGIGSQLPALLMALGGTLAAAVLAGSLMGPAQVAGRLLEFGALRHWSPVVTARLAALGPPLGVLALLLVGLPAAIPFALLHGAGNGILTISKGTLPLVLMGPQGYGARQGWLNLPGTAVAPLAPWIFGFALEHSAQAALGLSAAASVLAVVALLLLRQPRRAD